MKIRRVGAKSLHVDGRPASLPARQTDGRTSMTKLMIAFRNFASAPKVAAEENETKTINK